MPDTCLTVPTLIRGRFRGVSGAEAPRIYRGALPSPTAAMREDLLASASRQQELLIRFLSEMDRKLDAMLTLLQSESLVQEFPGEGHIVELSGQGLEMECNAGLAPGAYVELLIMLEEYPMHIISTLSQVERAGPARVLRDMHSYAHTVRYVSIAEEDREKVIRFVFGEERKRIRQRRGSL